MKLYFSNRLLPGVAISTIAASSRQNKVVSSGNTSGQTPGSGGASGTEAQTAVASADSFSRSTSSILSKAVQDALQAQAKQLNDMRDALAKLRAMPSAKVLAKSAATERAAMLKKILDMLKQMMVGATPAQAKAIAAQLKDIAKELASIGKLLSDGSSAATTNSEPVATGTTDAGAGDTGGADSGAAAQATAVESGGTASTTPVGADAAGMLAPEVSGASASPPGTPSQAVTGTDASGTEAAAGIVGASGTTTPAFALQFSGVHQAVAAYAAEAMRNVHGAGNSGAEKAVDDGLRSALQEALKSLRSLISMLKSKLGAANKDLNEAERKTAELARSLGEAGNQNDSVTDAQGPMQEQVAQDSGAAEAAAGTVTDSVDSVGETSSEISVSDAGGAVGGNISVSA